MKQWRNYLAGLLSALMLSGCALGISEIPLAELEQKYATGASRFIDIDGLRVHYRDEGEGQPIVLLHGILTSLHTWDGWVHELKSDYRVISLDIPAFGLTGPANFEYNRDHYTRFIHHFTQAIGLERFVLAGNSLGGYFAWNYAIEYPEQVQKLVLIDAAGFKQKVPLPMWAFTAPVIGTITMHFTPRFASTILLRQVYAQPERINDALVDHYYDMQLRPGNRKAAQSLFRYANAQSVQDAPGKERISMPTLLMWGEQDRWIPMSHFERWRQALPHAQSVTYPDAGHMPMEEIPVKSARDLKRFLEGRPIPPK
ncbi:2-hydroxy-6-oxo-6-(2'-aminophenyl)hexa-2, 4-dienoic acid hydrolase [Mariprofundus micogutta]|uniref:2-hydroxy-6-oxo-6-(2'-aminophenyl)hexa-2, 4-dienoic acid hydrolase n=1 Tax=Mariprofundus micogutta TaxID=1921010 RepID=A0A1L8CPY9_9PROT|nr:alpha/beta hydrolase [Mariprofundus micogutta]GAV20996.1 2-hydroxy-6-oxo-6-(2'-aminophenyl)hexa-2, 4-dienoic acid hydrolase [Mariprofundus micogutta]